MKHNFLKSIEIGVFALLFLLTACKADDSSKTEKPIAICYDKELYLSQIKQDFPEKFPTNDSIQFIKTYIQSWVKKQALLHKALNNIDAKSLLIEKKTEEYKNQLIQYEYEKQLIEKYLDTSISEQDIKTYYEKNKNSFILKDFIVKALYFKVPLELENKNKLDKWYRLYKPTRDLQNLDSFAQENKIQIYYNDSVWQYISDIQEIIPLKKVKIHNFITNIKKKTFKDSNFVYYINVYDYKLKDAISPLSVEYDNIKNIIKNIRANDLKIQKRREIVDKAYQQKKIKILFEDDNQ